MCITMKSLVLAALFLILAPSCQAQECNGLDTELREALLAYAANFYPFGEHGTCAETSHEAARAIIDQGPGILPCLLEVYEHGFSKNDLWPLETPPPKEGRWVLGLIGGIDSAKAIKLYRAERAETAEGDLKRVRIDMELAKLGDQRGFEDLARFLAKPPEVEEEESSKLKSLVSNTVELIGQHNYRPGLQALKSLQARGWEHNPRLKVFVAQLSEDVAALKAYARETEGGVGVTALRALGKIGRTDVLEELAADLRYRYHDAAEEILEDSRPEGR